MAFLRPFSYFSRFSLSSLDSLDLATLPEDAADDRLRSFCGALTPEKRLAAILIMGALFAIVNFYMIFRAIYDIGREDAPRETIEITSIEVPDFTGPDSLDEKVRGMEEFFNQFNTGDDEE